MRMLMMAPAIMMSMQAAAQSYAWWANNVHWDGVTPWERYLTYTPGFLGPNALPVPHMTNGSTDTVNSIGLSGDFYFSKGDHTQNTAVYANYCLEKNKVSFDLYWVPVEHFTMSYAIKTERRVFTQHYYDRYGKGDIHLNTNIQLINKPEKLLYVAARIGYRFPSSDIGAARFTDAPGYYFDFSLGKGLPKHPSLKWMVMVGGYFWQAEIRRHPQDDALLYGTGMEYNKDGVRLQAVIGGYVGYFYRLRDKPMIARVEFSKSCRRKRFFFQAQQGLHNYNYTSLVIGLRQLFASRNDHR